MPKLKIKSIRIEQFKGIKEYELILDGKNKIITGENGIGKTTIADAHFWLWTSRNYDLVSNPNIRPNDMEECLPKVEEVIDLDGNEIIVSKEQSKKNGANGSFALFNKYGINRLNKTEKEFFAYFSDVKKCPIEDFVELSHIEGFTQNMGDKKGKDRMREILFSMAGSYNDFDIAKSNADTQNVADMLEKGYSLDEVVALKTSDLKKAKEFLADAPAQIAGMEKSKVEIDETAIKTEVNEKTEKGKSLVEEREKILAKIEQLKDDSAKFIASWIETESAKMGENKTKFAELRAEKQKIEDAIKEYHTINGKFLMEQARLMDRLKSVALEFKNAESMAFDESTTICPTCNRPFDSEKITEIRANFERQKADRLEEITERGKKARADYEALKEPERPDALENRLKEIEIEEAAISKNCVTPTSEMAMKEPKYIEMREEIVALNEKASIMHREVNALRDEVMDLHRELGKVEQNAKIDEKIADLQKSVAKNEQEKADCEQILYEAQILRKIKVDMLTEEINNHFRLVRWKLFEYQKNGEYKECCIPMIDGKDIVFECNGALKTLAKLDIIETLQNFKNIHLPIIVDNAEHLTQNTIDRFELSSQTILLMAKDGVTELC